MPPKYVYAGYSKCGTKSIAEAFRILGYKVHDYQEAVVDCGETWVKFHQHINGQTREEKLDILREGLKDFDVFTDLPSHFFWKEIIDAFPDCKVIFYERPEDEWYVSWVKQVQSMYKLPMPSDWIRNMICTLFYPKISESMMSKESLARINGYPCMPLKNWKGEWYPIDETFIKRIYRRHNSDVLRNCPAEKLLNLSSMNCGWKEICDFTGDEIPSQSWPHRNKNAAITEQLFKDESRFKKAIADESIASTRGYAVGLVKICGVVVVGREVLKRRAELLDFVTKIGEMIAATPIAGQPEC